MWLHWTQNQWIYLTVSSLSVVVSGRRTPSHLKKLSKCNFYYKVPGYNQTLAKGEERGKKTKQQNIVDDLEQTNEWTLFAFINHPYYSLLHLVALPLETSVHWWWWRRWWFIKLEKLPEERKRLRARVVIQQELGRGRVDRIVSGPQCKGDNGERMRLSFRGF